MAFSLALSVGTTLNESCWSLALLSLALLWFSQLEDQTFTVLCWFLPYNNMNHPQVAICPLLFECSSHPIPTSSHPSRSSQNTGLSSLHHIANCPWLSVLHVVTCMLRRHSLNSSYPSLPPLCPQVCPLCLGLYSYPANRFISTIFLDSVYLHQHMISVFSFLLTSLYIRLEVHQPHFN